MIEIKKYWVKLLSGVSAEFGVSLSELKGMDIFDFYIWVVEYEKRIDQRVSSANKEQ